MRAKTWMRRLGPTAAVAALLVCAAPAHAQQPESQRFFKKGNFDGMSEADFKAAYPEFFGPTTDGRTRPNAIPDIFGPGAVLNVGSVNMKVTNYGFFGNPFTNLSSDPAGQWPGSSGVEYLNFVGLAVGAVNPLATDPSAIRRVSYTTEWRPQTLDPEDRIYRAYDGIINGTRFVNDDNDQDPLSTLQNPARIDEDFLDGRDNDGDGRIDEDYAAIGQQMYSCVIWDNTPQAINAAAAEKHVPLGMECRQLAWAYSIPGFSDFNVVEWTLFNRSGHVLDSLVVGGVVDMDCGPTTKSNYFNDDVDMGSYPSGEFTHITSPADRRLQDSTMRAENEPAGFNTDSVALCPRFPIRVNGFSVADDDGDENLTPGVPTFMLVDHTIDPLGVSGPSRVGFKAFRAYVGGTPYNQGGRPAVDQQRFELMVGTEPNNINEDTGFIDWTLGDQHGDWVDWWSVGPWRNVPDGGSVKVTVAFGVQPGRAELGANYASDYSNYKLGIYPGGGAALFAAYPSLENAYAIQVAFEGIYEDRADWPLLTNGHGRETMIKPGPGQPSVTLADCHDIDAGRQRTVTSSQPDPDWFDFDCSYCTGVYDSKQGRGMFHRTWNADAPPPSPNLNIAVNYNYSDNPDRTVAPGGDNTVNLAWDNLSEVSPDPKSGWFDFRGYRVWKVSNWTRPVGSSGPNDDDWALVGEFRQFRFRDPFTSLPIANNKIWQRTSPIESTLVCPRVFIPNYLYPDGHRDTATVEICLNDGDLWDRQTGQIIRPDTTVACVGGSQGLCDVHDGCINGRTDCGPIGNHEQRTLYKIGRYKLVDHEVKNGFVYFYSVTAFDSTGSAGTRLELSGRRAAVEAEGVVPQVATRAGRQAWVVPNPYRGYSRISDRPSSWDLTPNAGDPTGTHIDFMGLPTGKWTVRVYTVSGDLVVELKSTDPVNQSIRPPVTGGDGRTRDGSNLQQDNPNDGQARWNLISRNGQDIVSGVYIFTVDSDQGTQRGKFVVIR